MNLKRIYIPFQLKVILLITCKPITTGDSAADHDIENANMVLIWAFGQVYPDFNHKFLTDAEFTTAQNLRFFPVDELKYHGSENRGMSTINFFEAGMSLS